MNATGPIQIETKKLNVRYNGNHILKDVNITIPKQKITAIIGPSGCGKTTLLKSFNRLLELHENVRISGEILVDGANILNPGLFVPDIRKKMGLLSQRPYPLPMSIYENVAYGLRIHNSLTKAEIDARVEHNLKEAGIWREVKDRLHDPATELSVGQQQRLCVARATAVQPAILLCDEPTSALDPIAAKQIEKLLVQLKNDYTVVLVTHTLRQAKRVADHVIFLYFGKVMEQGPAVEVFTNPQDPETQAYLKGDIS